MKNLSSKIVVTLASLALIGAMYACTNTVAPPEQEETSKVESSSSVDADDESSSSEEEEVSSSSEEDVSSSSEEEVVSSSSEEDVSSSSEEVVIPEKVTKKDTVVTVDKDDVGSKIDEADLPEDLTKGDSLAGDDLFIGKDDLDFNKNEYYCKTPDGNWYVLEGSKYQTFWARLLNGIIKLFTGKTWLDYSKICGVIYVHPKF
ncbi:MAG: hypothetical protein MJY85_01210 [Fibrobacter sp.]|nr:hypothetical protein [Fibrobacter sp.]